MDHGRPTIAARHALVEFLLGRLTPTPRRRHRDHQHQDPPHPTTVTTRSDDRNAALEDVHGDHVAAELERVLEGHYRRIHDHRVTAGAGVAMLGVRCELCGTPAVNARSHPVEAFAPHEAQFAYEQAERQAVAWMERAERLRRFAMRRPL